MFYEFLPIIENFDPYYVASNLLFSQKYKKLLRNVLVKKMGINLETHFVSMIVSTRSVAEWVNFFLHTMIVLSLLFNDHSCEKIKKFEPTCPLYQPGGKRNSVTEKRIQSNQ